MQFRVNYVMVQPPILTAQLIDVKRRAMRHGAWFRVLGKTERAIINLTIHCVERVRSSKLAEIVTAILNKLTENTKSQVKRLIESVGRRLAQKISQTAQKWGNKTAKQWAEDFGFIQYLAIMQINTHSFFTAQ